MFEVSVKDTFSAAHSLRDIGGGCENLHGHNFVVEVCVRSEHLTDQGVVIDFRELKSHLAGILEGLDHCFLNDSIPFRGSNPSSEHIARFIYDRIKEKIGKKEMHGLLRVHVWESETSRASYWEENK